MTYEAEKLPTLREHPRLVGETWKYMKIELSKRSTNTQYKYLTYLTMYLDENQTDTDKLYNEVKRHLLDDDQRKIMLWESEVNEYLNNKMRGIGVTKSWKRNTVAFMEKALNAFIAANRLAYRYKFAADASLIESRDTRHLFLTESAPPITHEETKRLIEISGSPRDHSIFMMAKDSGLRISDVADMRICDVKPVLEDNSIQFYTWEAIPHKGSTNGEIYPANPVIGRDAIKYLRRWVNYARRKYGAFDPLRDDDYLYFKLKTREGGKWEPTSVGNREPLDSGGIGNIIRNA